VNTSKPTKANGIVFKEVDALPIFLLLKRTKEDGGFWQSVTGTCREGESIIGALTRETFEETGITEDDIYTISDQVHSFTWSRGEQVIQEFAYAVRVGEVDITLNPDEHDDYTWIGYQEALSMLGRENNKVSLTKCWEYIKHGEPKQ
jgi:8-oxo-dGTP pyrophosphatase MutT (NUDIX family)